MRQRSDKLMTSTPHRSSGDKVLIRLDSSLARAVADFFEIGSQALAVPLHDRPLPYPQLHFDRPTPPVWSLRRRACYQPSLLWLRGESRHASTDDVRHRGGDLLMSGLTQATGTLAQDARLDLVDPVYRGYYKRSGPGFACVIGPADLPAGQSPAKMTKPYPGAFFRVAILSSRGFR
jgi:hypothetical protein